METLSKRILNYAIKNEYIEKGQYEEYLYILTMLLNIIVTDITTLIIGAFMGMIWECITFWIIYKVLRKYCGGFHFSTSLKCYLSTCIMCPIILIIIKYIPSNMIDLTILTFITAIIMLVLSPVPAVNKPLDNDETRVFGKIARISILTAVIVYNIMICMKFYTVSKIISLSIISVAIFMIAGTLQLKALNKTN